jgi:hypothetical protein
MSLTAAVGRLVDRVLDGPRCPDCAPHFTGIHGETGCLGHSVDAAGAHSWCGCTRTYGKTKAGGKP